MCHTAATTTTSAMETLHQLAVDSFSKSWSRTSKHNSDSYDDAITLYFDPHDDTGGGGSIGSFIEMDPRLMSLRWTSADANAAHDFDFCLPDSHSPPVLAHADQIISGGLLLPLHLMKASSSSPDSVLSRSFSVDSSKPLLSMDKYSRFCSVPSRPISLNSSPLLLHPSMDLNKGKGEMKLKFFGSSSKKIIQKYLCFLMPLYKKVKGLRWVMVGKRKRRRSFEEPLQISPRASISYCRANNRAESDVGIEKSIHDAVLHCKKSIGRDE